jgi:outer membrane protein
MNWAPKRQRRTGSFRPLIVLLASVTVFVSVRAETLQDALVQTYQTNPDLAAEQARLRVIDEEVSQANAKWRPSLSIEADYERSSATEKSGASKYNMRSQSWSADLVAKQPLLTSGRNGAAKRKALARVRGANARLRVKEQRILLDAATVFVDVVRNEAVLDLVRKDISLLQDLFKEFSDRRDAAKATDSDVDQIQAALEAARAVCIAHFAQLQDSWRAYEQVVGEPPVIVAPASAAPRVNPCIDAKGDRQRSTIAMPEKLPLAPSSLDEVEKAAQGGVPELDEARAEEEASRYAVSEAYAELLPSAEITARLGTSGEEYVPESLKREASISAGITVPLFNRGAEWSEIRAARERNNQARLNITSSQRQITRNAARAWYELVSIRAVRGVNKVQAAAVLRAFEGLRKEMADPKLHRSITDLLGLRQAYLPTQTQLMASNRNEAIAVFSLLAAMGNLNAAYLELPVKIYDADANLKAQSKHVVGDGIYGE